MTSEILQATASQVTVLIGAQWGDEGKGKWIDVLSKDTDLVVRYQGGNNAGHTLYIDGQKVVLHQLPSGVFHSNQRSALAAGVVVNPSQLVAEMTKLGPFGVSLSPERLWLSGRAHVITPWHIYVDGEREKSASSPIGTTKRGIGPTYSEKAARSGLRLGHYVRDSSRLAWVEKMSEQNSAFRDHLASHSQEWDEFHQAAKKLAPFVTDAEDLIRTSVSSGQKVLLEGAQGSLLDLDHGSYPFVTSSSTGAGGACQSIGLSPRRITNIIGIAKGYVTRVGSGPFPTELFDEVGKLIAKKGNEFGATTGRPRRVGWMDCVALRYVAEVNGLTGLVLNKLDILTGIGPIKMATAYQHPKLGLIKTLPWDTDILAECTPVYEEFPGWDVEIPKSGKIKDLPPQAIRFVEAVSKAVDVPVTMVGTGPNRSEALYI